MSTRLLDVAQTALSAISAAQHDDADELLSEVSRTFRPGRRRSRRRRALEGSIRRIFRVLHSKIATVM